jgi:hypothetical protein
MSSSKNRGYSQINVPLTSDTGVIYVDAALLNISGKPATFRLQNEPTLNINRQSSAPISLAGFTCVNFAASGSFILQAASLVVNGQIYLFCNSSGFAQVNLALDNNGLVGGLSSFIIPAGEFFEFICDGTNLS